MKATLIHHAPLRLITARSTKFPDGNKDAFDRLEAPLETLRGRKFYGLAYPAPGGIDYYTGLVPADQDEEQRFAKLGFEIRDIAGGPCARMKLHDWAARLDQLGTLFGEIIADYGYDPTRPQIEFYRSIDELHLLVPVPPESGPA